MALDNWKKIDTIGTPEQTHRQNEKAREQDRGLDKRLRHAFENFRTPKANPDKSPIKTDQPSKPQQPDGQTKLAKHLPEVPKPVPPTHTHLATKPSAESPKVHVSHVYQPPSDPSATAIKNMPQTIAESRFVVDTPKPNNLANLLKSIPPTPPKTEDGKQQAKANPNTEIFQQAKEAPKVQAPVTPDAGGKLASAAKHDSEVGKKKGGEKKEGTERGEGKGSLAASRSGSADSGGRLEAAAGGVAGGAGEPEWIIDREPLVHAFNPSTKLEEDELRVLESASKFKKYVLQPRAAEVLARAVHVSEEVGRFLEQIKENIPPRNSYGVVRG